MAERTTTPNPPTQALSHHFICPKNVLCICIYLEKDVWVRICLHHPSKDICSSYWNWRGVGSGGCRVYIVTHQTAQVIDAYANLYIAQNYGCCIWWSLLLLLLFLLVNGNGMEASVSTEDDFFGRSTPWRRSSGLSIRALCILYLVHIFFVDKV